MIAALLFVLLATGTRAQDSPATVKVTDLKGVTTLIKHATTSSSSSTGIPDFPVLAEGSRKEIKFSEVNWISVLHGDPTSNDQVYIRVELTFINGKTEEVEMIKHIRFSGQSEQGPFSIKVMEVNTVQVIHEI
jgi:hypothetical protein